MAPRRLRTKHRIVQPSPGKRPFSEVYYEWSSGEEDTDMKEGSGEVMEDRIRGKEDQAECTGETPEKGDTWQTLYNSLPSSESIY